MELTLIPVVVNIISQTTQQNRISVELGSFDTQAIEFSGHLSDQTSGNDWKINWGIKAFEEEGWNFVAIDNNNVAGQTDYGEENLSVFVNGKVEEFSGEILYTRSHQGFIGASVAWPSDPLDNQRTMDSDRLFVNLAHQTQLSDHWQLNSHLSYSSMTFDHYNYQGYSNDKQLELTALYQPNKQFNGVLGGTLWRQEVGSKERLRPAPVPEFQATWYNFYGQVAYDISDHLNISSGLQWNKAEDLSPKTVFRMGLNYQMSDKSGVKVMHAQAYRAAFGVETGFLLILTNPDGTIRGGLRGNPQLDAEEISTTDVQWFYHTDNLQFVLTAYQSKLKKLITRERAPDNVIDFVNKGELTIKGFEFESKYNMNKIWHFMASYSYQWNQTAG